MAAPELPLWFIHRQISSAINIVVQTARTAGGQRKITQISEVLGSQGDTISMHDLFLFDQEGVNGSGDVEGSFVATGIHPHCLPRLKKAGVNLPISMFERGRLDIGRLGSVGLERCIP
jgi:pilus assembly protein CpaF